MKAHIGSLNICTIRGINQYNVDGQQKVYMNTFSMVQDCFQALEARPSVRRFIVYMLVWARYTFMLPLMMLDYCNVVTFEHSPVFVRLT